MGFEENHAEKGGELENEMKRAETTAELIQDGAKYVSGTNGPRLEVTADQIEQIKTEHEQDEAMKERLEVLAGPEYKKDYEELSNILSRSRSSLVELLNNGGENLRAVEQEFIGALETRLTSFAEKYSELELVPDLHVLSLNVRKTAGKSPDENIKRRIDNAHYAALYRLENGIK